MSNGFHDLNKVSMDEIRSAIYMTPFETGLADARHFVACVVTTVFKHLLPHDKPILARDFVAMFLNDHPEMEEKYGDSPSLEDGCVQALRLAYTDHKIDDATTDEGRAFIIHQDSETVNAN